MHTGVKLLHSPNLMAAGLLVWGMPCDWLVQSLVWWACLNIDWEYLEVWCILGKLQCILGTWTSGNSHPLTDSSLHSPKPLGLAVQGNCETVYLGMELPMSAANLSECTQCKVCASVTLPNMGQAVIKYPCWDWWEPHGISQLNHLLLLIKLLWCSHSTLIF